MLRHARYYAGLGIHVFPVHGIVDGKCTCNKSDCNSQGKHPLTPNGHNDATTDIETIEKWWKQWPNANVAGAMGEKSGIICMDIDNLNFLKHSGHKFEETVSAFTGKGMHLFYKYPNFKVVNKSGVFEGVDSRADGGYVVLAPSNHISGKKYKWKLGFTDCDLIEAPDWWLNEVNNSTKEKKSVIFGEKIGEGKRNDTLFTYAYDFFIKEKYTQDEVLAMVYGLNASKCVPPVSSSEVEQIVLSAFNRFLKKDEEQQKLINVVDQKEFMKSLFDRTELVLVDRKQIEKPSFMPKTGLIKDIAEYILSQSEKPLPTLAVAAACSFIGALAGRKYQTQTGLGTNAIFVGVAGSGWGKGKAQSIIDKISLKCGESVNNKIGASDIASGQGIISSLHRNPSQLFVIDEFGLFLQSLTEQNANPHKREIIKNIMILYSSYGKWYRGTAYADNTNKPQKKIYSPCLCIYGMTTPETLYKGFTSSHGEDGFLARLLIVDDGELPPKRNRGIEYVEVPSPIVKNVVSLANFKKSEGSIIDNPESEPDMIIVKMTDDVYKSYIDIDEYMCDTHPNGVKGSIFSRVAENASKLALIYAISINHSKPIIDHDAWEWGLNISAYCAEKLIEMIDDHVSDSKNEEETKKYLNYISKKTNGVSARDLQNSGPAKKHKISERNEFLAMLTESGRIKLHEGKYFSSKNYQEFLKRVDKE